MNSFFFSHLCQDLPSNNDDLYRVKRCAARDTIDDASSHSLHLSRHHMKDADNRDSYAQHGKNGGEQDAPGVVGALCVGVSETGRVVLATSGRICALRWSSKLATVPGSNHSGRLTRYAVLSRSRVEVHSVVGNFRPSVR